MKFRRCVAVGGALLFAYSLTGPALKEAIRKSHDESSSLALSSAERPAFDLPHIHFEIDSKPVATTLVEIAATGAWIRSTALLPIETL